MTCPKCGSKTAVIDNVNNRSDNEYYRRRKCKDCGYRFYTLEFEAELDENFKSAWYGNHRSELLKNQYESAATHRDIRPIEHKKKEVKMYAYINYLEKNTTLNRIRIKKILDINTHKLLSIGELYEIARALGVELYELFEID